VDFLLLKRPAMLSAIFLILMWGWPFIVACGTFDLYAGDIASRQLRYQLLRADRGSIFVGRLLGTLVTFICVLLLIGTIVPLYMGFKLPVYSWGSLCGWSLYGTVAMIVMSLPYIALCAWISAAVGSAFGSLTIASVVIGGVPLIVTLGGGLTPEFARWLKYALPWGYQTRLFHHEPLQVAAAAAGCVAMTALFLWLGYRKFTRRDL
jgi:ABC-type transport system involved in multi-copper enzyme maturation permease subunit